MPRKIIIFAGAPASDSLDWTTADLLNEFTIQIPTNESITSTSSARSTDQSSLDYPVWRSVTLMKGHIPTGLSQHHASHLFDYYQGDNDFFDVLKASQTSLAGSLADELPTLNSQDALSQFYEHSLAVHYDIPSSQLLLDSQGSLLTANESTSFLTTSDGRSFGPAKSPLPAHRASAPFSDLSGVPTARHITNLLPQTLTANFIVGIISIAAPRTVKTRWGHSKSLVEVLVGDETRSGFAITFWLPSDEIGSSILAGLRPQDIVLVSNVALNVFMGKVYGGSLRKNTTKAHLLYRRVLDDTDVPGHYSAADLASSKPCHPQLRKTKRVREWVLKFIGGPAEKHDGAKRAWDKPPPVDSQ